MIEIGIMIEGQEDLTWERFFQLADAVEALGFDHLFRSDHLTPLSVSIPRETLALWPSLTALAQRTERIRFGPMVCSMTFRQPVMVAKMAASVSVLSHGRLDLGLGAGWYQQEHAMFGLDYPPYGRRLTMLDEGATVIKSLFNGQPTTFHGRHYQLDNALNLPGPQNLNIIMGGKGERTLKIVAKQADEWNCSYVGLDVFKEKSAELDKNCLEIRRDPATLRRSLMVPFVIGPDDTAVQQAIHAHQAMFPNLPGNVSEWLQAGFIGGQPQQVIDQIGAFAEAGIDRFMLQHNALGDLESLSLLATAVLPYFRSKTP